MLCGGAVRRLAGGAERRAHEVVVEIVDAERVGPLVAVALHQRGRQLRHAVGDVGERRVLDREHGAARRIS